MIRVGKIPGGRHCAHGTGFAVALLTDQYPKSVTSKGLLVPSPRVTCRLAQLRGNVVRLAGCGHFILGAIK